MNKKNMPDVSPDSGNTSGQSEQNDPKESELTKEQIQAWYTEGLAEYERFETQEGGMEGIITRELLQQLSMAEGSQFGIAPDPGLIAHGKVGYTNMNTKVIYYSPFLPIGKMDPTHPRTREQAYKETRGLMVHEAFHHAPPMVKLQKMMLAHLQTDRSIIPEAYRGSEAAEGRFIAALYSNIQNAIADIWLEAYAGKRQSGFAFQFMDEAITELRMSRPDPDVWFHQPKPLQYMFALMHSRFWPERYYDYDFLQQRVDPDVFEALKRSFGEGPEDMSNVVRMWMDVEPFDFFPKTHFMERSLQLKFEAYRRSLDEFIMLMEAEVEKRKQQKQNGEKGDEGDEGDEGEEGQEGEGGKPGKSGKGKGRGQGSGQSQGGGPGSDSVPMTKEEEESMRNQIRDQLLDELANNGKEMDSGFDPDQDIKDSLDKLSKALSDRHNQDPNAKQPQQPQQPVEDIDAALRRQKRDADRKAREMEHNRIANQWGVDPTVIKNWKQIKEKYAELINRTAAVLAEVFIADRRLEYIYDATEGPMITPGLEFETIGELMSGSHQPETYLNTTQNPEFLATWIEFIIDKSGSMSGDKIERSREMVVIMIEIFQRIRAILEGEDLLINKDEQPFRVGLTLFDTESVRVTGLDAQLSDEKQVIIVKSMMSAGGGTSEVDAIESVYGELSQKIDRTRPIKIIVVLTDGQGEGPGVHPIMQKIDAEDQVVFLIVGLGDDATSAQAILDSYIKALNRPPGSSNVVGIAVPSPKEAIPTVTDTLVAQVKLRKDKREVGGK